MSRPPEPLTEFLGGDEAGVPVVHPGLIHGRGEANTNWRGGGFKTCATCGATFKSYSKTRRFCSLSCRSMRPDNLAQCRAMAHRPRPNRAPRQGLRLVCKHCGRDFRWPNQRLYCIDCKEIGRMNQGRPGHMTRRDDNHGEVVEAFEQGGACVLDLSSVGGGVPDIIVSYLDVLHLVEIKNGTNSYGRRGLNKRQRKWAENWRGSPVIVVHTPAQARKWLAVWRERRPTLGTVLRAEHAAAAANGWDAYEQSERATLDHAGKDPEQPA